MAIYLFNMNAERKKEYRSQMPEYQKAKYLEYLRKKYDALSDEQKAAVIAKRKAHYQENKERLREYSKERYHRIKEIKKND
jgi:hypothetical protein